jgi:hypothetical protein
MVRPSGTRCRQCEPVLYDHDWNSVDFTGTRIEFRGFLKTEDVSEFMGLWMRVDGEAPNLAFDSMQSRQLKGTRDWTEYSIALPVNPQAKQLYFGVLMAGTGKTWADDLQLLVDKPTEFVRFTNGDLSNPGAFHWGAPLSLTPGQQHYGGKVVILVDESSQSQAEYTTMAFRSVPGAIVIGSTTAGADGNVSNISLPGGFSSMISGIGVFYPDKKPTQRVGIVPNVEVKPTVAGIRDGRDEVLEEALRQLLGADTPAERIRSLAKP